MVKLALALFAPLLAASLCLGVPATALAEGAASASEATPASETLSANEAISADGESLFSSVSRLLASDAEALQVKAQREAYVTSLYVNVFGRTPDDFEVAYHVGEMENGRTATEVASVFFGSDEFASRGYTPEDAAQVAYISLLGRSASAYEVSVRAAQVEDQGILFVVDAVLESPEFEAYLAQLPATNSTGMEGLAQRLDALLLGNDMTDALRSEVVNSDSLADGLIAVLTSDEFAARGYSARQIAQVAAYALTGAAYAGDEIGDAAAYMENGMSESKLVDAIMSQSTSEVSAVADAFGIERGKIELTEPRDQNINVSGFATRLYTCILGRDPDTPGLNVQCQALLDGAEAITIVNNYFVSDEFSKRDLSNEERVRIAYNTMLDREPESAGLVYWTKYLDAHMTISSVVKGFSQASEFIALCKSWGLNAGTLELSEPRDTRMEVTAFVSRLYENVLGRDPDIPGLNVQCQALLNGMPAAQIAYNFFMSGEFESAGHDTETQVTIAYNTLLDREPEQYGLEGWSACMDAGMPLDYLVAGFADSDEFAALCADYGIERGWLDYDGAKMAAYMSVITPASSGGDTTGVTYDLTVDEMLALNLPYVPEYLGYTDEEVRDAIDPSTATGTSYYQFADLRKLCGLTASQIDSFIASTANGRAGTMAGQGATIVAACREAGLNEVYALCHAILETGWGTSDLASGYYYDGTTPVGGEYYPAGTYYNFFGIGAYDSGALSGGRALAIKNGWNSPAAALAGGIAWIARNYTYSSSYPQVTIYEMKWDPQRASDTRAYGWHQFATSITWPSTISTIMGECLSYANLGADSFSYIVPSYR